MMGKHVFVGEQEEASVKFSVVIPAHNEEKYIGRCLESIAEAAVPFSGQVEVIVVLNRCQDGTEQITRDYNCVIVENDMKNLSQIRNAGASIARGNILVTIDADSRMTPNMLLEIDRHLQTGSYIGGGVSGKFERVSLGIIVSTIILIIPMLFKYGSISVGIFWCYKKDFDAIGGFNDQMLMSEDADFALQLKKWGVQNGKKFGTIKKAQMITSCRKFDQGGDWILLRRPQLIMAYLKGTDRKYADEAYYEDQIR
jgi:glycosyltransferase involved in cell wall biosynthesis